MYLYNVVLAVSSPTQWTDHMHQWNLISLLKIIIKKLVRWCKMPSLIFSIPFNSFDHVRDFSASLFPMNIVGLSFVNGTREVITNNINWVVFQLSKTYKIRSQMTSLRESIYEFNYLLNIFDISPLNHVGGKNI